MTGCASAQRQQQLVGAGRMEPSPQVRHLRVAILSHLVAQAAATMCLHSCPVCHCICKTL